VYILAKETQEKKKKKKKKGKQGKTREDTHRRGENQTQLEYKDGLNPFCF
jgi:ribosome assembly protein YihI (activator of Der GTPase)